MICPKCGEQMLLRHFGPDVSVRSCRGCGGLWATVAALDTLKPLPLSEVLDRGDRRLGAKYDHIGTIDCPGCARPMAATVDPIQPHIRYERCDSCAAIYFDAGEYTDWKRHTIADWFRALFAPPRVP
jgi:Zn-finger nucleic acid-binding protein